MSATTPLSARTANTRSPWRSVGLWMSALLVAYMLLNAVRATADPASFAAYFGIPLNNPSDDAFVLVYAIRTLFLGLFGLALFVRRSYTTLALFLLVATVIPIGDALLVWQRGSEASVMARHIAIAGFVLLTWLLTSRWVRRASAASA
jgi:hypothetical protein